MNAPGVSSVGAAALARMLQRVEVRPAVLIRDEDEPIVGGPVQVAAAGGARQRIHERALRSSRLSRAGSRRRLGARPRPDRPRLRLLDERRLRRAAAARLAHERDLAAVRGPQRATRRARSTARDSESAARAVKMPMKLWSSRFETNASARPSGDHAGDSLVPRAKNACSAGFDPSSGAIQMRRSLHERDRLLRGAIAGASPSPSSIGRAAGRGHRPDLHLRLHRRCRRVRLQIAFGGQFEPWSPPRT